MSIKSAHTSPLAHVMIREVFSYVWHYYRRHKPMVIGAYIAATIASFASILNPYTYAWLVDVASAQIDSGNRHISMIVPPILATIGVSILHHIAKRTANLINCFTDSKVQADIATDATAKVHLFEMEWHANHFTGSMVTAIKRGRSSAHALFDEFCYEFWPALFVAVISIVIMTLKSLYIGIFFLLFALAFSAFSILVSRRFVMPYNRAYSEEDSRLGGVVADSLSGHSVVKSFSAEKRENIRLREAADRWQQKACTAWQRINLLSLSQNILINIGRTGALLFAAYYWANGKFTAGDVIYVMMAQRVLADYLDGIGNNLNRVTTAINDIEEVVYWAKRRPKIETKPNAKTIPVSEGAIGFHRVSFAYNEQGRLALNDFNLSISPGEKIALVGPSGGGKSTVLKLLQRFYEPQQGIITVDGHDIQDMDLSSLRAAMALVPQDPILFHRSLTDNIAYGQPNASFDEVKHAAKLAQISSLIETLPNGYNTLVGERGIKLSGGERQRVAIARAILANTPVLLLDEATSALDSEAEEKIQLAIAEAAKGRTMIAIAHRLSTIQSADRIIVITDGRILEQGSHRELLAMPNGLYRRLYEAQAKGFLPDHLV